MIWRLFLDGRRALQAKRLRVCLYRQLRHQFHQSQVKGKFRDSYWLEVESSQRRQRRHFAAYLELVIFPKGVIKEDLKCFGLTNVRL